MSQNTINTPYSTLKIFHHLEALKKVGNKERAAPIYIRIKPINLCNHHCYYCSYADSELGLRDVVDFKDQIPWDRMQGVLRDIAEMGVKAVTFSGGGEPLMYPHIVPTMQSILDSKIDLSIITNGHLLAAERAEVLSHAKWVRFSFDASRAETYSLIRKIPLAAHGVVCGNMENFAKIKNPQCELGVNFVINHENFAEILEAAELVKSLGANHIKFSARITKDLHEYHAHFKDKAIELVHKAKDLCADKRFKVINKYEEDFDTAMVFHRTYKKCYIKDVFTVIAADSKVYFCHDKAYVSTGVVGDLSKMGFKELWYSPEVIKRYEEFDACEECNHHCVFDDRNMMLNSYFDMDMNHVNFI